MRLSTPVLGIARDLSRDAGFGAAHGGRVSVRTHAGIEWFDDVVLAAHAPQALALLDDASADERRTLGAIGYQDNEAVLHTDERLLPRRRAAWAAWNYERDVSAGTNGQNVCLHYLLNQLQPLPWQQPVIVSLNPLHEPRDGHGAAPHRLRASGVRQRRDRRAGPAAPRCRACRTCGSAARGRATASTRTA